MTINNSFSPPGATYEFVKNKGYQGEGLAYLKSLGTAKPIKHAPTPAFKSPGDWLEERRALFLERNLQSDGSSTVKE